MESKANNDKIEYVYLIITSALYQAFRQNGVFNPNDQEYHDPFIHLCTEIQAHHVINKFYADKNNLMRLEIRYNDISEHVKWEGRDNAYPHLYAQLTLNSVIKADYINENKKAIS